MSNFIDREEALMCVAGEVPENGTYEDAMKMIAKRLQNLPYFDTTTKVGKWRKDVSDDPVRTWDRIRFYCSACDDWTTHGESKYCPNCGARMEKEDECRTRES